MANLNLKSQGVSTTPFEVDSSVSGKQMFRIYEGNGGHGNLYLFDANGDKKVQIAAGTNKTWFNNGQNVGIGTTNPQEQLDVVGTIQCTGLKIQDISDVGSLPSGYYPLAVNPSTGEVVCYVP